MRASRIGEVYPGALDDIPELARGMPVGLLRDFYDPETERAAPCRTGLDGISPFARGGLAWRFGHIPCPEAISGLTGQSGDD
ncbi:protein of unknown function [Pararobbsia alpina]